MTGPYVRKNSFGADVLNAMLLRPVYRESVHGKTTVNAGIGPETTEIVVEEDKTWNEPVKPKEERHTRYRYNIDLDELEYATLMQLVMKYGSGTGHGGSTSVGLRIALAEAEIRSVN